MLHDEALVPLADAARRSGYTLETLRRKIRLGRIRGARKIFGRWRIPAPEVARLLAGEIDRRENEAKRFSQ